MAYPNDDDGHFLDGIPFPMDENEHEEDAYSIPNVNNGQMEEQERVENVYQSTGANSANQEKPRTQVNVQRIIKERDQAFAKVEQLKRSLLDEKSQTEKRLKMMERLVNEKVNMEARYLKLKTVAEHEIARCQEESRYQSENASKLQEEVSNLQVELSNLKIEHSALQDELAQSKETVENQSMSMVGMLKEQDALRAENIELKRRLRSPTSADEWNLLENFMKENYLKDM